MTELSYRQIPAYANSDLSELKARLLGKQPFKVTQAALDFGTAFHTLILEPATFDPVENLGFMPILNWMRESLETDTELVSLLQNSDHEIVRQWIDPATGLPCKGKLDAVVRPRNRHLIDLKTTSSTSLDKFAESCLAYDYDRQAAFYLSSDSDATFFEFVGVQKQSPYRVYRLAYHKDSEFVQYGRKKMNWLLKRAHEESLRPDGWRPSAWGRERVTN
ncbi:MAG: hypothetical protein JWP57_2049 [Spirosoma sp.]|nr:hypothetical protein [Spirosoma sp.]